MSVQRPFSRPRHRAARPHHVPDADIPPVLAGVIVAVGKALMVFGALILAFAGFQLWGTGVAEARAQADLEARFNQERASRTPVSDVSGAPEQIGPAEPVTSILPVDNDQQPAPIVSGRTVPKLGEPVGMLSIPAIDLHKTVVEGTTRDALRSGPGHYRSTPLPGLQGNTAIAGHRTTHGAPFFDIDLLVPGDEIHVETLDGHATYIVEGHPVEGHPVDGHPVEGGATVGHRIVDPDEVGVIADHGDNRLTLTACHPKYSAKQRIVVSAILKEDSTPSPETDRPQAEPAPVEQTPDVILVAADAPGPDGPVAPPPPQPGPEATTVTASPPVDRPFGPTGDDSMVAASLGWQRDYAPATVAWGVFTAVVALAGWAVGRLWRTWPSYAMAVPPFSLSLFYCFSNLERFIPAV